MMRTLVSVKLAAMLTLAAMATTNASAAEYKIDTGHSSVMFNVVHFGVAKAFGRFNDFSGSVTFDEANPGATVFNLTMKVESIDTASERRDKHLRSPDFFNAVQFPEATFKSTSVKMQGKKMMVTGDLTMLGKTVSVSAEIEMMGPVEHPRGGTLRGFFGTTTIKRSDFGMNYGIEQGALADEVEIIFSLETKAS